VIEAWPDLHVGGGSFWIGEDSKALLDAQGGPEAGAMRAELSLSAEMVSIFYGPHLCDVESLPREESLRARVLSGHGIAAAWITLGRDGERVSHEPESPQDPVFHQRRPGSAAGHLWRRFDTRRDAIAFMENAWGAESEGADWARALPAEDFESLLRAHARREVS
jgi:hypothetical protein